MFQKEQCHPRTPEPEHQTRVEITHRNLVELCNPTISFDFCPHLLDRFVPEPEGHPLELRGEMTLGHDSHVPSTKVRLWEVLQQRLLEKLCFVVNSSFWSQMFVGDASNSGGVHRQMLKISIRQGKGLEEQYNKHRRR